MPQSIHSIMWYVQSLKKSPYSQLPAWFSTDCAFSFILHCTVPFACSVGHRVRQVRVALRLFVLRGLGLRGLARKLTDVCPLSGSRQACRKSGKQAERLKLIEVRGGDGQGGWAGRGRITTGALCPSSLGWRSVREASNWPMRSTDGASGWIEEKPGQTSQMHFWMTHKPSVSYTPTQRHEAERCSAACCSCLQMKKNRKGKSLLPLTLSLDHFQIIILTYDCTVV